jgi:hypothetical protein
MHRRPKEASSHGQLPIELEAAKQGSKRDLPTVLAVPAPSLVHYYAVHRRHRKSKETQPESPRLDPE